MSFGHLGSLGAGFGRLGSGSGTGVDPLAPGAPVLSATSVSEDAAVGAVIGTLTAHMPSGTYTFTITSDPDSKFQIANDDELQVAAALDYETDTSHQVTIEADNGVDDPVSRIFTINVVNVVHDPGILVWTSDSSDSTPEFNITGDVDAFVEGKLVFVRYSANSDMSGAVEEQHEITAGEVSAQEINLGLSALANGTWYVQTKFEESEEWSEPPVEIEIAEPQMITLAPEGFPWGPRVTFDRQGVNVGNAVANDAAGEKYSVIGRVRWEPGTTSDTLSAAGGGQIGFSVASSTVFANGSTTIEFGLQDVDIATGQPARPDGTFDVSRVMTGGVDTITSNAWNTKSLTGGSGSKTIANGDLIAVVFNMTGRGGADVINYRGQQPAGANANKFNCETVDTGSGWVAGGNSANIMLISDNGKYGIIDWAPPLVSVNDETFDNSTNPDERGIIFELPGDVTIDAIYAPVAANNATTGDYTIRIYSDPLGTPTEVVALTKVAEEHESSTATNFSAAIKLPSPISLSAATTYVLAVKADNGNLRMSNYIIPDQNIRKFFHGGTTVKRATRNNASGAFAVEATPITLYRMGFRITELFNN